MSENVEQRTIQSPLPETPVKLPNDDSSRRKKVELGLVGSGIAVAHVAPFSGALGFPLFAHNGCHAIAECFGFLAAYLLTVRVLCHQNITIDAKIGTAQRPRVLIIEAIGAAVLLAWLVPWLAVLHVAAEILISALGVTISILVSAAVSNTKSRLRLEYELANVAVLILGILWTYAIPPLQENADIFLTAFTVGTSSFYSFSVLLETMSNFEASPSR